MAKRSRKTTRIHREQDEGHESDSNEDVGEFECLDSTSEDDCDVSAIGVRRGEGRRMEAKCN